MLNIMFSELIDQNMEVYVNDMLLKSKTSDEHVADLKEAFVILRRFQIKLDLTNYTFGVSPSKFLGFLVN